MICNGTLDQGEFYKSLAGRLGVKSGSYGCSNGCYIKGSLEMYGCKVRCEQKIHEFGQPVNDVDEAAKFICWQLRLEDSYLDSIKRVVKDYMIYRNGQMYIPKSRSSCVITCEK